MSSIPSTPFITQTLNLAPASTTSRAQQRNHGRPSVVPTEHDRARQQVEAAEIMRNLGLASVAKTPERSSKKLEEGTAKPNRVASQTARPPSVASSVSSLVSHSAMEKRIEDQEYLISTLRSQISTLTNERNSFKTEVVKLKEKEGGGKTTLKAKDIEELRRQFEAQEKLLEGYQKENEKCMVTIEELRKKERLYGQALKKLYGEDFENTLLSPAFSVSQSSHSSSFSSSFASPPINNRSLSNVASSKNGQIFVGPNAHLRMGHNLSPQGKSNRRGSMAGSGNNTGDLSVIQDQSYDSSMDAQTESGQLLDPSTPLTSEPEHFMRQLSVSPSKSIRNLNNEVDPTFLLTYLEQVHMLVKGMERRFIEREGELEELEKKARGEDRKR